MGKKKAPANKKKYTSSKRSSWFKNPLSLLAIAAVVVVLGFLAYSVTSYQQSEQEKKGFLTCSTDGTVCELSQHIHSDIEMTVCDKEIIFPKEKGNVNLQHTHKETNKLHWHARVRVDPITQEPLDKTPLTINAFLEQMEYAFPDTCPQNNEPTLSVYINEEATHEGLEYVWQDGDQIKVMYQ